MMCDVCQAVDCKYKCPSCKVSSCSLACFKKHKAECSETAVAPAAPQISTSIKVQQSSAIVSHDTLDLSRLEALFTKHPTLRPQLRTIYLSTLEPGKGLSSQMDLKHRSGNDFRRAHASGDRIWNAEKGLESGMSTLRSMIENKESTAEAIQEFLDTIAPIRSVEYGRIG